MNSSPHMLLYIPLYQVICMAPPSNWRHIPMSLCHPTPFSVQLLFFFSGPVATKITVVTVGSGNHNNNGMLPRATWEYSRVLCLFLFLFIAQETTIRPSVTRQHFEYFLFVYYQHYFYFLTKIIEILSSE